MIKKLKHEEISSARPTLEEAKNIKRFPLVVLIENIRSLYNVGSIFRTSDGACIEKLYIGGYTGCPPRKEIDKTALGSVESVPWEKVEDPVEKVKSLKEEGYQIVVLEHTDSSVPLMEAEFQYPTCLILGNEVSGVTEELCKLADLAVEIPMYGLKQSLNVAVAYGIAVYHIVESFRRR